MAKNEVTVFEMGKRYRVSKEAYIRDRLREGGRISTWIDGMDGMEVTDIDYIYQIGDCDICIVVPEWCEEVE